jgi:hypothetical protein
MSGRAAGPFSPRVALGLVLFGALSFVALLWIIGSGMDDPGPRASGAHIQGKGLTGYAALGQFLTKRGYTITPVRSQAALDQPGVLILTPEHGTTGDKLNRLVQARRGAGPTIVVLPKWLAIPLPKGNPKAKNGHVMLLDVLPPDWKGFYDNLTLQTGALETGPRPGGWSGAGLSGQLPNPKEVFSGRGQGLVPLVTGDGGGQVLAGYIADGGDYQRLRALAVDYVDTPEELEEVEEPPRFPVIFVFDADLFNNYGMGRQANAMLAEKVIQAALDGNPRKVAFDLTLAGYGRSPSLLALAFTPPFLAATLCLLLAAAVALWRAYQRFGPPVVAGRALAFGKRELVGNAAGLIQRARRLHLLGPPYADAARERLVKSLALPSRLSHEQADAAIDRALAARAPGSAPFSETTAQLRAARKPTDLLRAARQLHALERTLTR